MRKAMIFVTALLALVQLWPTVFGHGVGSSAVVPAMAAPKSVPAVATGRPALLKASVGRPAASAPKSCYRTYQAVFAACSRSDDSCHVRAADQWDLCEATGIWPS